MFWTGGSKNNLQRKNKNLMISRPQFYPLRKALLKEKPPQSLFLKHGHALQLWSTCFSLFLLMTPPFILGDFVQSLPLYRLPEVKPHLLSSFSVLIVPSWWIYPSLVSWLQGLAMPFIVEHYGFIYILSLFIYIDFAFGIAKKLFSQESEYISVLH